MEWAENHRETHNLTIMTEKKWVSLQSSTKQDKLQAIIDYSLKSTKEKIIEIVGLDWFLAACRWKLEELEFFTKLKEY